MAIIEWDVQSHEREMGVGPVLIFGKGLVGRTLQADFSQSVTYSHSEVDITDGDLVERMVRKFPGSVVINAAGKTDVDRAETEPESYSRVHVEGNRNIALACLLTGKTPVFFSSEMVFPGDDPKHKYFEDEIPDPNDPRIGEYAKSKARGELVVYDVFRNSGQFLMFRISHPSAKDEGWFYKMVKYPRLHQNSLISPTLVEEIPTTIRSAVEQGKFGVYHIVATPASPLEIACYGRKRLGIEKMPTVAEFSRPEDKAPRPQYGVLSREKTMRELGYLRTWKEQVDFLTSNVG